MELSILGRSSSHFTRVVRMFAHELGVDYVFRPVPELSSRDPSVYGGNPALKIPALQTVDGAWFGALNICRELERRTVAAPRVMWPEQLRDRMASNAQELVLQGMSTEVALIMQASSDGSIATSSKGFESLTNSLRWLDENLPGVRAEICQPEALSFLDLTTYCFVTHLDFRQVADLSPYRALHAFCEEVGRKPSARATSYRFDFGT
jgi:glutathione S-transferase